ncbi:MAG: ATP synthase subunit I [Verrucomicrobiales bacterium]
MNEAGPWILAGFFGLVLGLLYFGGLWWTIRKGVSSPRPAVWFFASAVLRTGLVLAGFYWVGAGQCQRLVAALEGFYLARLALLRWTRGERKEDDHAS